MKKTTFFFLLFILFLGLTTCRKGCVFINPGEVKCYKDFSKIENAQTFFELYHFGFEDQHSYIVQDTQTYDTLFYNYSPYPERPFSEIDFEHYTLIGMDEYTSQGKTLKYEMGVCENTDSKTIVFTARYSLKYQCAGSGIQRLNASFWAIIPKVSEDHTIIFEAIDANPH